MPANVEIFNGKTLVWVTPEGEIDCQESKAILGQIKSITPSTAQYYLILDARKTRSRMSIAELWELAVELSNLREAHHCKLAVLCAPKRFDRAIFFALCAQNRGIEVQAFSCFENAFSWLTNRGHQTPLDILPAAEI